jgi:hypothetical protein
LVTARSVLGAPTLVVAVALSLPGVGSVTSPLTVAVSETEAPVNAESTEPVTVSVTESLGLSVPSVQPVVVQVEPVIAVMASPLLGASATVTPVAVDGPLLVTVTV